jgi:photosystem II stability/assembly factor-like uncharacterized protein
MRTSRTGAAAAIVSALAISACDPGGFRLFDTGRDVDLRGIWVNGKKEIYLSGASGTVLVTDGNTTTDTSTNAGNMVRAPDWYGTAFAGGSLFIGGDQGLILEKSAMGWKKDSTPTNDRLLTMIRPAPSILYAGGDGGRVLRRSLEADAWQAIDVHAPASAKVTGGWGISDRTIVFTTDSGVIVERTDKGWVSQTVSTETSSVPLPLFGVWSATKGADLVAVGLAGSVFRRRGGEATWTQEKTSVDQDLYAVFGTSNDHVYAVGAHGTILQYDGTSWNRIPSTTGSDLFAIGGLSDGSVIAAAGAHGTLVLLTP